MIETKTAKEKERELIIALYNKKKTMREIAYILDISKSKVNFWIKRYKESNLLEDKKRKGRTPKLTNEQIELLKEAIKLQPSDKYRRENINNELSNDNHNSFNNNNYNWTPNMLMVFIKGEFGVDYSLRFAQNFVKKHKPF